MDACAAEPRSYRKLFPTLVDKERIQLVNEYCNVEHFFIEKHGGILYQNVERVLEELSQRNKLYMLATAKMVT